jgi:hypothetical protein
VKEVPGCPQSGRSIAVLDYAAMCRSEIILKQACRQCTDGGLERPIWAARVYHCRPLPSPALGNIDRALRARDDGAPRFDWTLCLLCSFSGYFSIHAFTHPSCEAWLMAKTVARCGQSFTCVPPWQCTIDICVYVANISISLLSDRMTTLKPHPFFENE